MWDIHFSNVSISLSVPLILQVIKSAHSCCKGQTHFGICFASILWRTSYHYYCSEKLFITRSIYFPTMVVSRDVAFIHVLSRFPLRHTRRGWSMLFLCSARCVHVPRPARAITYVPSFLWKHLVSLTCIYVCSMIGTPFFFWGLDSFFGGKPTSVSVGNEILERQFWQRKNYTNGI